MTPNLADDWGDSTHPATQLLSALAEVVGLRDAYTAGHNTAVGRIAERLCWSLDLDAHTTRGVTVAATLHDIGKVGVPMEILTKPTRLSEPEFELMKCHPLLGSQLFDDVALPWEISLPIAQHHEQPDGSGYPYGLAGDQILFGSRIIAVADAVDSMVSHRPYRPAQSLDYVAEVLAGGNRTQFDPDVVGAALVMISNGEIQPQQ